MVAWNGNWTQPFQEKVQTEADLEIGRWEPTNSEIAFMRLIENVNPKDWNCISPSHGLIRLKERRSIYVEN